jgi:hypothetical protein
MIFSREKLEKRAVLLRVFHATMETDVSAPNDARRRILDKNLQ